MVSSNIMYIDMNLVKKCIKNNPVFDLNQTFTNYFGIFNKFLKKLKYKYIILLITLIIADISVRQVYNCKVLELQEVQSVYNKIRKLQKNKLVYKKLQTSSEQLVKYIEKVFACNYAQILEIKVNEPVNFNNYFKLNVKIQGTFVHDKFIFETIESLYLYEGFVRISGLKIDRSQLTNGINVLNTVIACELYMK